MKLIGYLIAFLGIIGLGATTFPSLLAQLPFLQNYSITNITLGSAVLIVIGLLIASRSKHKVKGLKGAEVPIFDGDMIIGYRKR